MNTFSIKMLAVALMVVDHVGLYFPGTSILLRCVGRLSYPLFLFCMVWGYHYTRNRKVYLLRLYLLSLAMTALSWTVDTYWPTQGGYGNHNIFLSMFLVGVCISTVELFHADRKKGWMALGGIFVVQVVYFVVPLGRYMNGDLHTGIVPNLALNEYGFEFVALGVAMYFLKEKMDLFVPVYVLFCIYQFSGEWLWGDGGFPIQWLMIFALPVMLKFNGEKGPGWKYFFYVFYPAHTLVLFYLGNFVF